jgi:hypothetical protein
MTARKAAAKTAKRKTAAPNKDPGQSITPEQVDAMLAKGNAVRDMLEFETKNLKKKDYQAETQERAQMIRQRLHDAIDAIAVEFDEDQDRSPIADPLMNALQDVAMLEDELWKLLASYELLGGDEKLMVLALMGDK